VGRRLERLGGSDRKENPDLIIAENGRIARNAVLPFLVRIRGAFRMFLGEL